MSNYDNIKLEKGLYSSGNFTKSLESIDPSENYKGTALEGLDAYQRQLKRFGIKVSGSGSDVVEKFFKCSDSAVLFPEYITRAVKQGLEQADILPDIVASTTLIDGMDYRSISSVPTEDDKELRVVKEGAFIPETTVRTKDCLVKLKKRGRSLVASYEAIRFQRLDLFTVTLRQIGAYISKTLLQDAVHLIINGENALNRAEIINSTEEGTVSYKDLINFWNQFDPYELNTIIATPDLMAELLGMEQFRDAAAGLNFHGKGEMVTPLGAKLLKSSAVKEGYIIGLDKFAALEMVKAGEIMTEYDKLIDRQLERAVISCTVGFAKIFNGASKVLSV